MLVCVDGVSKSVPVRDEWTSRFGTARLLHLGAIVLIVAPSSPLGLCLFWIRIPANESRAQTSRNI